MEYSRVHRNQYLGTERHTLESYCRLFPKRNVSKDAIKTLKYYKIKYACMKGASHKPEGDIRAPTSSSQECPAFITILLSKCSTYLYVATICEEHDHQNSPAISCQSVPPRQRLRVDSRIRKINALPPKRPANKELVLHQIVNESGNLVTCREISTFCRIQASTSIEQCLSDLHLKYKCEVTSNIDGDNNVQGIFFQDEFMKRNAHAYHDIILIDGINCTLGSKATTYLLVVEDGEGNAVIVAVAILLRECQQLIEWFLATFKAKNEMATKIEVVLADTVTEELSAIEKVLPNVRLRISQFHMLATFKKDLSRNRFDNLFRCIDEFRAFASNLSYAQSEGHYRKIYEKSSRKLHPDLLRYYDANWHAIRWQWVLGLTSINRPFGSKANNMFESVNQKIKSMTSVSPKLEVFIRKLFIYLRATRRNQAFKMAISLDKTPLTLISHSKKSYYRLLTCF